MTEVTEHIFEDSGGACLQDLDSESDSWVDSWTIVDFLCLAAAVSRSRDRNWASICRTIQPFGDPNRPDDFFTPTKCALQYEQLVQKVQQAKVLQNLIKKVNELKDSEGSTQEAMAYIVNHRISFLEGDIDELRHMANSLDQLFELLTESEFDEMEYDFPLLEELRSFLSSTESPPFKFRTNALPSDPDVVGEPMLSCSNEPDDVSMNMTGKSASPEKRERIRLETVRNNEPVPSTSFAPSEPVIVYSEVESQSDSDEICVIQPSTNLPDVVATAAASNFDLIQLQSVPMTVPQTQLSFTTVATRPIFTTTAPTTTRTNMQPFFKANALASAAARQLFVATTPVPDSSLLPHGTGEPSTSITSSVTSSAPTLSKLLEMPISRPGRLPSLPNSPSTIDHPDVNISLLKPNQGTMYTSSPIPCTSSEPDPVLLEDDTISNDDILSLLDSLKSDLKGASTDSSPKEIFISEGSPDVIESESKSASNQTSDTTVPNPPSEGTASLSETEESSVESGVAQVSNGETKKESNEKVEKREFSAISAELKKPIEKKEEEKEIICIELDDDDDEIDIVQTIPEKPNKSAMETQSNQGENSVCEIDLAKTNNTCSISDFDNVASIGKQDSNNSKEPSVKSVESINSTSTSECVITTDSTVSLPASAQDLPNQEKAEPTSFSTAGISQVISGQSEKSKSAINKDYSPLKTRSKRSNTDIESTSVTHVASHSTSALPKARNDTKRRRLSDGASSQKDASPSTSTGMILPDDELSDDTSEDEKNEVIFVQLVKKTPVQRVELPPPPVLEIPRMLDTVLLEKIDAHRGPMLRRQSRSIYVLPAAPKGGRRAVSRSSRGVYTDPRESEVMKKSVDDNQKAGGSSDNDATPYSSYGSYDQDETESHASKSDTSETRGEKDAEDFQTTSRRTPSTARRGRRRRGRGRTRITRRKKSVELPKLPDLDLSPMYKVHNMGQGSSSSKQSDNYDDENTEVDVESIDDIEEEKQNIGSDFSSTMDVNDSSSTSPTSTLTTDDLFSKMKEGKLWSPQSSNPASQSVVSVTTTDISDESYNSDVTDESDRSSNATQKNNQKRNGTDTPEIDSGNKRWKKAVNLVWREVSYHKNANVFSQKVTDDMAPGYEGIVFRPMDLSLIKRNIDNGVITNEMEFQRDAMLMFQNAIMYNSQDHNVYKMAVAMQKDVNAQIEDFSATQFLVQDNEDQASSTSLRGIRTVKAKTEKTQRACASTSAVDRGAFTSKVATAGEKHPATKYERTYNLKAATVSKDQASKSNEKQKSYIAEKSLKSFNFDRASVPKSINQ